MNNIPQKYAGIEQDGISPLVIDEAVRTIKRLLNA